jgi:uncharacterized membrane protein
MRFLIEAAKSIVPALLIFILIFLVFEARVVVPTRLSPAGRLHPILLHFPIVTLLLAFGLELLKKQLPVTESSVRWFVRCLLLIGTFTSAWTVVFGLLLSKEAGYTGNLLQWHKWIGTAVFVSSYLLWIVYEKIGERLIRTGMAVASVLLLIAGHLGASLTHGEGFLTEPFQRKPDSPDLSNPIVYTDLIVPVLKEKCFGCHNPDKAKGGLVMTDTLSFLTGGDSGSPFASQVGETSQLMERLLVDLEHEHRMPPKGKPQLSPSEIALIQAWIDRHADFQSRLDQLPDAPSFRKLAEKVYGSRSTSTYEFPAADRQLIQSLNSSYRLVAPVSYGSPALNVSLFGQSAFSETALKELLPIAPQVISLHLAGMPVTDNEIALLASFQHLEKLNLNHTAITGQTLDRLSHLKNLHTLQLSGTVISASSIEPLLALPKLRKIYAWDTGIQSSDLASLISPGSSLQIEIGATGPDSTLLQLNRVAIHPENAYFRAPFSLELTHPIKATSIYYTLDGSEPDPSRSDLYENPILIEKNTVVKAKPVKDGWLSGEIKEKSYLRAALSPEKIDLVTSPAPQHKGQGAVTLFDLQEGSTDILYASDGKWLAYQHQDLVVELQWGSPKVLQEISLSTLTSVALEAFPPMEVTVVRIDANGTEKLISKVVPEAAAPKSKIGRTLITCPINDTEPIQRVRITARPISRMPAWHSKAGKPAWLFVDEILIN